jgi:hypothetical protein
MTVIIVVDKKGIEKKFPTVIGERLITSYDYLDLARGKAIQEWYGFKGRSSQILIERAQESDTLETIATAINATPLTKRIDEDFDITFDKPQIIEGVALVKVIHGIKCSACVATASATAYIVAKIRRWNGVSEYDLASATSRTLGASCPGGPCRIDYINGLEMTLPRTKFAVGDVFRLTIEVWTMTFGSTGTTWTFAFGHDPPNRTSPSGVLLEGTMLLTSAPLRIDT